MFSGGYGAVSLASYVDPTKPRLQPDRPTNVDLPDYTILIDHVLSNWTAENAPPNFKARYTQLKRPSDVNGQLLYDFNIDIRPPSSAVDLVPKDCDGRYFLPKLDDNDASPIADSTQANQSAFDPRHQELTIDNDIIYRIVCREKLPEGVGRIRLANFRSFFSSLEGMSEHWETDLDHYFIAGEDNYQDLLPRSETPTLKEIPEGDGEKTPTGPNLPLKENIPTENDSSTRVFGGFKSGDVPFSFANRISLKSPADEGPLSPTTLSGALNSNGEFPFRMPPARSSSMDSIGSASSSEADIPIPMYRGRRISSGIKMPGLYRTSTVKGFLEAVIFHFNCKLSAPRAPAILMISGLRVPIRHQTFLVQRMPSDRAVARQGITEGPVMTSFVRQDIEAYSAGTKEEQKERLRLDLLKELGCLLLIAQERRRDGQVEKLWKKEVPKCGHWFSEMASDQSRPEDTPSELQTEQEKIETIDRKRKKVKTKYDVWKEMQPQRSMWDPKVRYTAIGREEESDWDEVYMLSSMYHHISVVKLRVHGAYIDYLTYGKMPDPIPEDPKWCQPTMQRSRWLDMFDIRQRVEAFRCLWGVMCYLTRQQKQKQQQPSHPPPNTAT